MTEHPCCWDSAIVAAIGPLVAETDSDDAARIVACVNALEGVTTPSVIPELIEALKISNAEGGSISPAYWLERLGIR